MFACWPLRSPADHAMADLSCRACTGSIAIIDKLLAAGCDLHIKNSKSWMALHSAASNGHFEAVLRLVQHGAAWRQKAENDVVKMICKKSSYKYVEGSCLNVPADVCACQSMFHQAGSRAMH